MNGESVGPCQFFRLDQDDRVPCIPQIGFVNCVGARIRDIEETAAVCCEPGEKVHRKSAQVHASHRPAGWQLKRAHPINVGNVEGLSHKSKSLGGVERHAVLPAFNKLQLDDLTGAIYLADEAIIVVVVGAAILI